MKDGGDSGGRTGSPAKPGQGAGREAGAKTPVLGATPPAQRGKYLLLDVPNFNEGSGGTEMRTYLRLGAIDPLVAGKPEAKEWGEDLAVRAKKPTRLDGVTGSFGDAERSLPYTDQDIVFEDDVRERDPSDGSWPIARRLQESDALHTKGGWRDHSDGNRISTTRGDSVAVIRGNYKLVVLGRQAKLGEDGAEQEDPDDLAGIGSGFDISGGEVRGMGMNLGEFETTSVTWVADRGRYRFVEKNQKADTFSIYWGDVHEEFFGEWKSDVTGSENPDSYPHPVPETDPPKVNPKILSRTWAESIEEYTGSSKRRIPTISSETWAEKIDELTDVLHGTTSNTRIGGGTAEATTIGAGTISATTIGGGTVENTVIGLGTASNTLIGGGTVESTIVGLGTASLSIVGIGTAELSIVGGTTSALSIVGGSASSLSLVPMTTEVSIGSTASVSIGDDVGVKLGNSIAATLGDEVSAFIGKKASVDLADMKELFVGTKASFMIGPYIDFKLEELEIKIDRKKTAVKDAEQPLKKDIA